MNHLLICMRLADMKRVHPRMINGTCTLCGETVGIYPSGQVVLKTGMVDVVCQVCRPQTNFSILAPGARQERSESVEKTDAVRNKDLGN